LHYRLNFVKISRNWVSVELTDMEYQERPYVAFSGK